jgi:predicted enzyme related to lactoylglutathione lyase
MALARWKDLCIDAVDASELGSFWGTILGLAVEQIDDGSAVLRGTSPGGTIWVNGVPEPRTVKHRVHLDLDAASLDPIVDAGATVLLPAEDSGFPWSVLADPEGGEFCVFVAPDHPSSPPATRRELVVDTVDVASAHDLAAWWAGVLGARVVDEPQGFSRVADVDGLPFATIDLIPVPEGKVVKNRIHWDVSCDDLPELLARGAVLLTAPTDDTPWHVLADPQGNEFCVFASRHEG